MLYRRVALITLFFCLHWLLLACGPVTIKDATNQSYIPIQGWVLELHKDVDIPPRRTRVFFQEGRMLYGINDYKPHCQLRVRDISEQSQSVHADRFSIENVYGFEGDIVSSDRIRLAAVGDTVIAGGGGSGGDNGESRLMYFYFMGLHAEKQSNVTYLVCGGALEDPAFAEYPTIQEIRAAMGDYATLVLPGDAN